MCFPEPYEIAMSNLGIKILYHMLNEREDTVCERCFFPWQDFSDILRLKNIPLFSIESKKFIKDFDILGFSIHHELCYTNILHMLSLAGLPFYSKDRTDDMPLIIAGGPCSLNPQPYADFFDLIIIGEGEESLNSLCSLYIEHKKQGFNRQSFFEQAAKIEGVFIPSFLETDYDDSGRIKAFKSEYGIKKAYVKDIDKSFYPVNMIVPNLESVHDRAVLELYRGCSNGCRFCQAGFISRPIRQKSISTLTHQAKQILKNTGFEELSLSSLSTGDYPCLKQLIEELEPLKESGITFSLPSLRLSGYLQAFAASADSVTFAPEAATARLRNVINKNITEQDITAAFEEAFSQGQTRLKLYFMCGLPSETEEDIKEISRITLLARQIFNKYRRGSSLNISVSLAVFIPKPFTPFQWESFGSEQSVKDKQMMLKEPLSRQRVKYSYHSYDVSMLECIFSRGDGRLSKVIERAYELGCVLDSWSEYFDLNKWKQAFSDCGIDYHCYLRQFGEDEILPWDFFDSGISKRYLLKEREKAFSGETTRDCRQGCNGCGADIKCCDIAK
jgi:radical SAM family uncharacterized protein